MGRESGGCLRESGLPGGEMGSPMNFPKLGPARGRPQFFPGNFPGNFPGSDFPGNFAENFPGKKWGRPGAGPSFSREISREIGHPYKIGPQFLEDSASLPTTI